MALVVEDGTGLSGAQVYDTIADCASYLTARGLTAFDSLATDALKETALLLATEVAEGWVRGRVDGVRRISTQALIYPRRGSSLRDGTHLDADDLPTLYRRGIFELAEVQAGDGIILDDGTGQLTRENFDGHEIYYRRGGGSATASRYPKAWQLISTTFNPSRRR